MINWLAFILVYGVELLLFVLNVGLVPRVIYHLGYRIVSVFCLIDAKMAIGFVKKKKIHRHLIYTKLQITNLNLIFSL